jgi:hypothetical protein
VRWLLSIFSYKCSNIAGQLRRLVLKSGNIRQHNGNQIACILTILNRSGLIHTQTFRYYLVNCGSAISGSRESWPEWIDSIWSCAACSRVTMTALIRFRSS